MRSYGLAAALLSLGSSALVATAAEDACCSALPAASASPFGQCAPACRNPVISQRDTRCEFAWDGLCAQWAKAVPECNCAAGAQQASASFPDGRRLCTADEEPKFINELRILDRVDLRAHPPTHLPGPSTDFYAYGVADEQGNIDYQFPGPTIIAQPNVPTYLRYHNRIEDARHLLHPWIETAPGLHIAELPNCSASNRRYERELFLDDSGAEITNFGKLGEGKFCTPITPHLHGGRTADGYDGYPEILNENQDVVFPHAFDNTQEGGSHNWIHDHTLGITRLQVHAGMVQNYLIREDEGDLQGFTDDGFDRAYDPTNVSGSGRELELTLSDRNFDAGGNLLYSVDEVQGIKTEMLPEYFGTHMLVNGVVWPTIKVPASIMRLRILNAFDSRMGIYQLVPTCPGDTGPRRTATMHLVGRDQGFLDTFVPLWGDLPDGMNGTPATDTVEDLEAKLWGDFLFLPNGARADVFVDFQGYEGCKITLTSSGDSPFGREAIPIGKDTTRFDAQGNVVPTGEIMQFEVVAIAANDYDRSPGWPAGLPTIERNRQLVDGRWPFYGIQGPGPSLHSFRLKKDGEGVTYTDQTLLPDPESIANFRDIFMSEITEDIGGGRLMATMGSKVMRNGVAVYDPNTGWCDDETYLAGGNPLADVVNLGDTEAWRIWNISPDGHPYHIHLVNVIVVSRCPIALPTPAEISVACGCTPEVDCLEDFATTECIQNFTATYATENTILDAEDCIGSFEQEHGPLDMVVAYEGYVTTFVATFDRPGTYVHHCHILSHEDNEMMRPYCVVPPGSTPEIACQNFYIGCGYENFGSDGMTLVQNVYGMSPMGGHHGLMEHVNVQTHTGNPVERELGCFETAGSGFTEILRSTNMSPSLCAAACAQDGFPLAAVSQDSCGCARERTGLCREMDTQCDLTCAKDTRYSCGSASSKKYQSVYLSEGIYNPHMDRFCGDGIHSPWETCASCPADAGHCGGDNPNPKPIESVWDYTQCVHAPLSIHLVEGVRGEIEFDPAKLGFALYNGQNISIQGRPFSFVAEVDPVYGPNPGDIEKIEFELLGSGYIHTERMYPYCFGGDNGIEGPPTLVNDISNMREVFGNNVHIRATLYHVDPARLPLVSEVILSISGWVAPEECHDDGKDAVHAASPIRLFAYHGDLEYTSSSRVEVVEPEQAVGNGHSPLSFAAEFPNKAMKSVTFSTSEGFNHQERKFPYCFNAIMIWAQGAYFEMLPSTCLEPSASL